MTARDLRRVDGSGSRFVAFGGVFSLGLGGLVVTVTTFVVSEGAVVAGTVGDFGFWPECRK
jgi:hypothetical protein